MTLYNLCFGRLHKHKEYAVVMYSSMRFFVLWFVLILIQATQPLGAQDPMTAVIGSPAVKGWIVLRASFPARGTMSKVCLELAKDGEWEVAPIGLLRSPFLAHAVENVDGRTTLFVHALSSIDFVRDQFFLDREDEWQFRWTIDFTEPDVENLVFEQRLQVQPAKPADLRFIQWIGRQDLLERLFRRDLFTDMSPEFREWALSREGEDYRALIVLDELLNSMRFKEPGEVASKHASIDQTLLWGDTLLEAARTFPDSSYAPYAAYYAGLCYVTYMMDVNKREHGKVIAPAGREHPAYRKAHEALTLARDSENEYLVPRALFHMALTDTYAAEWNGADTLLSQALSCCNDDQMRENIAKVRAELERLQNNP